MLASCWGLRWPSSCPAAAHLSPPFPYPSHSQASPPSLSFLLSPQALVSMEQRAAKYATLLPWPFHS